MSLPPITTAIAAIGAANVASNVAGDILESLDFRRLLNLNPNDKSETEATATDVESADKKSREGWQQGLLGSLDYVQRVFAQISAQLGGQSFELSKDSHGEFVVNASSNARESIESALNQDHEFRKAFDRLHAALTDQSPAVVAETLATNSSIDFRIDDPSKFLANAQGIDWSTSDDLALSVEGSTIRAALLN